MRRAPSLIEALVWRFALVAALGIALTLLAHGVLSPPELTYELEGISQQLEAQLELDGEGRLRLEPSATLRDSLSRIPGLELRVFEVPSGRQILALGGTPDTDGDDDIEHMKDWPEGKFQVLFDDHDAPKFGFVAQLRGPHGQAARMVALRGAAEARDLWYGLRGDLVSNLGPGPSAGHWWRSP